MPDIIFSRRSIRQFTPEPVENETLILLLKAAMAARTTCNSQPWEFIVVTQQERLDQIRDQFLFARYNAPAAIVACGNIGVANNSATRGHWVQDCSAVTQLHNPLTSAEMTFGNVVVLETLMFGLIALGVWLWLKDKNVEHADLST